MIRENLDNARQVEIQHLRIEIDRFLSANRRYLKMSKEEKDHTSVAEAVSRATDWVPTSNVQPAMNYQKFSPEKGDSLIRAATRGDGIARQALNVISNTALTLNQPLPAPLSQHVARQIRLGTGPKKAGRKSDEHRNDVIVAAILICLEHGLKPTRGRTKAELDGAPSACSLVAKALSKYSASMAESSVDKVWENYTKILRPIVSDEML